MNEEQFDKLMKAINEINNIIFAGIIGFAIFVAAIVVMIINLLQ